MKGITAAADHHAGSMTFSPRTSSKWRRLNVATSLPRSNAVAATMISLSPFISRGFEGLARGLRVAGPRLGLPGRQGGPGQRFSQTVPGADLLAVGHQPGERHAVLEQHKRHILVVSAVDAIGEVPRRFGDGDGRLFHKIRLSDFMALSIKPVRRHRQTIPRSLGGLVRPAPFIAHPPSCIFLVSSVPPFLSPNA